MHGQLGDNSLLWAVSSKEVSKDLAERMSEKKSQDLPCRGLASTMLQYWSVGLCPLPLPGPAELSEVKVAQSCLTLSDSMEPARLLCPWNFPGQKTGLGCCSFLQRIFPIQGPDPGLPHCRWILYHLSHHGSPLRS